MKKIIPKDAVLIPDNATRVFAGDIFEFYQWPQVMFDGSTKTFEMLKRPDTVEVLAIKGDKIIVVSDEQPGRGARICLPGGRVDPDDSSWLAAAQREFLEETGMSFRSWRLINVVQPVHKIEWFAPLFLATDFESKTRQGYETDGEKIEVIEWGYDEFRQFVVGQDGSSLGYLAPLLLKTESLNDLLSLPAFSGQEVDR